MNGYDVIALCVVGAALVCLFFLCLLGEHKRRWVWSKREPGESKKPWVCVKCGNIQWDWRVQSEADAEYNVKYDPVEDILIIHCMLCGYGEDRLPLDHKEDP
jgi:hypothetical protein